MAPHHLGRDALDHLRHVEEALFGRDLRMEDDLEEEVAQLTREVLAVPALDRLHYLVGLFDRHRLEALVGLLPVPGAASRRPQPGDQGDEGLEGGPGPGALVGHGRGL